MGATLGVAGAVGGVSLPDAAARGWPRAEWVTENGAPFAPASLRLVRGVAPAGAVARLRILMDEGDGEREVESVPLALDTRERIVTWPLPYPYAELRDVALRYALVLETEGFGAVRSEPLTMQVLRYRFGS